MPSVQPNGQNILYRSFSIACKPREKTTVSAWADNHRILTSEESPEPGRWRTRRVPHIQEPMDALSLHSTVKKVVCMFPIQLAKTEIGQNWIAYIMSHCPAPILSIQPKLEGRNRYVLQRIEPMIKATPALSKLINVNAKRESTNNRDTKKFPGGLLVLSGANSPASVRSMPMKYVITDEIDEYEWELGGQGDTLGLIQGRQSAFSRSKILIISSPTIKDASRIHEEFLAGDQRHRHVPCPHCGEYQILHWKNLKWLNVNGQIKDIYYQCTHHGCVIRESSKTQILPKGRWIAQNKHPQNKTQSYTLNSLYAMPGLGLNWQELIQEWLEAQRDPAKLKRFINTRLAEPFEDTSRNLKWDMLSDRAENYPAKSVPPGALILTTGIDTQNDRIAIVLLGHGKNNVTWIIDYLEIPGDPNDQVQKFKQKKGPLYDYLNQPFTNAWGKTLHIQASAWDTGGQRTDAIYTAVRSRVTRRLMAIKGWHLSGKPILAPRPSAKDVNWRGKIIKKGVQLWMIGTDTAKDLISARLGSDAEKEPEERLIRFSQSLDKEFYKMLVAEKFDPEKNKWICPRGRRNEALDCLVYGLAAARHPEIRVHAMAARGWKNLQQMLEPTPQPNATTPADPETTPVIPTAPATDALGENRRQPRTNKRRRASGFINNW